MNNLDSFEDVKKCLKKEGDVLFRVLNDISFLLRRIWILLHELDRFELL